DAEPEPLHAYLNNVSSDLPATHKLNGLRGHTSEPFMCDVCEATFTSLTNPECFDPDCLTLRDDWRFIKYAFLAQNADEEDQAEILDKRGVQWSILDALPDWLPGRDSPPDFMHAAYLGETKHVIQNILHKGGMFTQRSRHDKPLEKMESFLRDIWWPASVSRPPDGLIATGAGKADQWRNFVSVLVVGLYVAWQINGCIPDRDAPLPRTSTKAAKARQRVEELLNKRRRADVAANPETTAADMEELAQLRMSRNYQEHYENTMEWATAIRIYGSQSISVQEAMRAARCHERACQTWARMFCHLVPYFHIMIHFWLWVLLLGPVYAWWTYAYERNNGFLSRLRHNGHTGGELEGTMMRGWTKVMLIYELIEHLESLGANKTPQDSDAVDKLRALLKGDTTAASQRGTLLTMIATMAAEQDMATIQVGKQSRKVNLRELELYVLVFTHLRALWEEEVILKPDTATLLPGEPFVAVAVQSCSTIHVCGLKFGASTSSRGEKSCYAYINSRQPVKIIYLLHIVHARNNPTLPPLTSTCAVVHPFLTDDTIPEMPWSLRASDLGIACWRYEALGAQTVIDACSLTGHFALAHVLHLNTNLWVTMSLDHVSLNCVRGIGFADRKPSFRPPRNRISMMTKN
ncbi:hypothetical protein C2E23DRAFT_726504, partial [Lenzites betulinus]